MGGSPGSSARCFQCRQRRRKCDLGRPCQRCLNAGTDCSGPTETRIYVHLNARVIHTRSHRNNLHEAFATHAQLARQRQRNAEVHQATEPDETHQAIAVSLPPIGSSDHMLHIISARMLYASLTDEFKPTSRVGIFSGDRMRRGGPIYSSIATGIRGLLSYVSHDHKLLDLGLFTLLIRYFGAFREDEKLVNLARSSYTTVLGEFQNHICSMEHMLNSNTHDKHTSRALLCLCLALLLFEMVDQPTSKQACEVHIDGALKVLQITGPAIYGHDSSLQYIFSGLRGLVIPIALRRRRRTFLADKTWLDLPLTISGRTKQAKLHDLAIRLPDLIERTDILTASRDTNRSSPITDNATALKLDYLSLREDFIEWFNHIVIDDQGPIYWYTSEHPYIKSEEDPICIPHLIDIKHNISFRDGPRAGLLAHYWSYRLELVMGLLDVCRIDLHRIEDAHMSTSLNSVPDLDVNTCLQEANNLAQLILETIPYLSSCLEGRITMQGPLETLSRYHAQMGLK